MNRQPASVDIIRTLAQTVEQDRINQADKKCKGSIRITHNEKQGCLFIPQHIQIQLVIHGNFPYLFNVKGSQTGSTGNQDRLRSLSGSQLILLILPYGKVIRVFLLQRVKKKVNRIFETFVILPHLHSVQHFYQRGKILFIGWSLIVDIADQCSVEQGFRLHPKIVSGLAFAFGIGD